MSRITSAAAATWAEFVDGFIGRGFQGKEDEDGYTGYLFGIEFSKERGGRGTTTAFTKFKLACFGIICGIPSLVFFFIYKLCSSQKKTFPANATDDDIENFCKSPAAMAVTGISLLWLNWNIFVRVCEGRTHW